MVRKITPLRVAAAGLVLLAIAAALFVMPSDDYILLPDHARSVAPLVEVEGERPPRDDGGIYFIAVDVRKASLLERLIPSIHDGATLVPGNELLPPGVSESQRRQGELRAMSRSQQIAGAVALRQLGYKVRTEGVGVLVSGFVTGSPAIGKLQPSDVIVGVDGKPVRNRADLLKLVQAHKPGDELQLTVRRGSDRKTLTIKTTSDPRDPKRAVLGVFVDPAVTVKLPLDVKIDLGNVGGPSAGLAFALDLYDELGHDINHGLKVAATGEIELNGTVAPVGGVKQKTIGVLSYGVGEVIVPAGENAREARKYAHGLRIIPVKSFQQALRSLATLSRA